MGEQKTKPLTVAWAVDAFEQPDPQVNSMQAQARETLAALGSQGPLRIVPIYVLSPRQLNLSFELGGPLVHEYRPAAERGLQEMMRGLNIPGLEKPQVIAENLSSTSQAAKTLAMHAYAFGADLILATSHGRRGLSRLLLGSFAENLLYHSRVPVAILRPQIRIPPSIRTLLFPSEFGACSKSVFKQVVDIARRFSARIILFHAIPHPIDPILQSGAYLMGGSWVPVQSYFSSETDRHIRRAQAWARWAGNQGVGVEPILDTVGSQVGESIVYLAKTRKVDLVAIESKTGPVLSTILGSVTRHVIHHADCPVWVLHARPAAQAEREEKRRRAA